MTINRIRIRTLLATAIVLSWLYYDLWGGGINAPTWELRLMLVTALIWMFGESVSEAANLLRGSPQVEKVAECVGPVIDDMRSSEESDSSDSE